MPNLLTIPQEIRDEIYDFCILSPIGTVEPICRQEAFVRKLPGALSARRHFFLATQNYAEEKRYWSDDPDGRKDFTSISLLRTNKQINEEATPHFYKKTTFYFPSPKAMERLLEGTTYNATQYIRSISFSLGPMTVNFLESLGKAIRALAKRTEQKQLMCGEKKKKKRTLQSVELIMNYDDLRFIANRYLEPSREFTAQPCFDNIYAAVASVSASLSGVTKMIRFVGNNKEMVRQVYELLDRRTRLAEAVSSLSWAWGGDLYWDSQVIWKE